jgi:cytochrome P450
VSTRWRTRSCLQASSTATHQLAFGRGIHLCAGKNLAHIEGQAILGELARRVERFDLAGEPEWLRNNTLHGLRTLPTIAVPAPT